MATVSDCHSSAAYSLQPAFVALKIVRSLVSRVEVFAIPLSDLQIVFNLQISVV